MLRGAISSIVDPVVNHKSKMIVFLEMINEANGRTIRAQAEELEYQREVNRQLLQKIGVGAQIKHDIATSKLNPIGGFVPLRIRIAEAEEKSRVEFANANPSPDEEE